MFKGAITALITPFKDEKIDEKSYQDFISWQIDQGIDAIVASGTTGESPTLSHDEHNRVFKLAVEAAAGRIPVIAGAGSNSTREAISLAREAKNAKADAILVATPYYNKPNQEGLYQHYKAMADSVDIPMILYNIPGRSVIDMADSTTARLSKHSNIVGLKDATGDLSRVASLRNLLENDDFILLSGEDATAIAFNAQGGVGCISVTSNIAPKLVAKMQSLTLSENYKEALAINDQLMPLHLAMFCDSSPAPAKYAASTMGLCTNELRLPLVPLNKENELIINNALSVLTS